MSAASSRTFRNIQIAGRPAPVAGPVSTDDLVTYKSADGTRYAVDAKYVRGYKAQARQERTGEALVFELEAVIGKRRTSEGKVQYLALWAAPFDGEDDASWQPADHFLASDIRRFEAEQAELVRLEALTDARVRQEPQDAVMQDGELDSSDEGSLVGSSTAEEQTAEAEASADSQMADSDPKNTNRTEDDGLENFDETLDFFENDMDLDDAEPESFIDRSYHNSVPPAGDVQFHLNIFSQPASVLGSTGPSPPVSPRS